MQIYTTINLGLSKENLTYAVFSLSCIRLLLVSEPKNPATLH